MWAKEAGVESLCVELQIFVHAPANIQANGGTK